MDRRVSFLDAPIVIARRDSLRTKVHDVASHPSTGKQMAHSRTCDRRR
jgi:hypothetical protein